MKTKRNTSNRPERGDYPTPGQYVEARDAWKARNPNMHTAEEERRHLADMEILRARPKRHNLIMGPRSGAVLASQLEGRDQTADGVVVWASLSNGAVFVGYLEGSYVQQRITALQINQFKLPDGSPAPVRNECKSPTNKGTRSASPASPKAR